MKNILIGILLIHSFLIAKPFTDSAGAAEWLRISSAPTIEELMHILSGENQIKASVNEKIYEGLFVKNGNALIFLSQYDLQETFQTNLFFPPLFFKEVLKQLSCGNAAKLVSFILSPPQNGQIGYVTIIFARVMDNGISDESIKVGFIGNKIFLNRCNAE